jgi:cyclophilin family peptidyl-prolyl cis-trans isomerase/HEAT repeat protein
MRNNTSIIIFLIINLFFGASCKQNLEPNFQTPLPDQQNKFSDGTLCKIYALGYNRNTKDLKPFFSDENSRNKLIALQVAASLQDSSIIQDLIKNLYDSDDKVRMAASFALGQLNNALAAKAIREVLDFESTIDVKAAMMADLGKCGNDMDLDYIMELDIPLNQLLLIEGQGRALAAFSLRNIHSAKSTRFVINRLDQDIPVEIKDIYSLYFTRLKAEYLSEFLLSLKNTYKTSSDNSKMHIIKAFSSIKNETSLRFLKQELEALNDYRLKVNALGALEGFSYNEISEILIKTIENGSQHEAVKASEVLLKINHEADLSVYFNLAQKNLNTRVSANLIKICMDKSKEKNKFTSVVTDIYESQQNSYHKSFYIKAFSSAIEAHAFVSNEIFNADDAVVKSAAMETFINMRLHPDFDSLYFVKMNEGKENLKQIFAQVFKKAIQSGDAALVSMVADLFSNTELNMLSEYSNTFFLQQAIEDCKMPRDIEAYLSLIKALKANNIGYSVQNFEDNYALLDWNFIRKIPREQKMLIKTNKGDIEILLLVEQAPATVAYFIKQSFRHYYRNTFIHRVVPNFVVQGGDFRGDGWGTSENLIRSEFSSGNYLEGTLGIASAGKDTESTQWFVTMSEMPHLDGKYTIFAQLTKGMEIVHNLEIGDKILDIELL